mmetsp:Transcript_63797/g.142309  ORF Transcript_63797/g.142309 Transcript_63797/m.142309 type:complete len:334 (-) Transcript_63797:477-1478(-)
MLHRPQEAYRGPHTARLIWYNGSKQAYPLPRHRLRFAKRSCFGASRGRGYVVPPGGRHHSQSGPQHAGRSRPQRSRDLEGSFNALTVVEPRVAVRLVVLGEHLLEDTNGTPRALRHVLPGHLDMDPGEDRTVLTVDLERLDAFADDVAQRARLELVGRRRGGVAVDTVALPHHRDPTLGHRLDMCRQHRPHFANSVASDQDEATLQLAWIQDLDQILELARLHTGSHLDPDRVLDSAEVLDVSTQQLARTITNPDHVRAEVVVALARHLTGKRLFQIKLHSLMSGENTGIHVGWVLLEALHHTGPCRVARALLQEVNVQRRQHRRREIFPHLH